MPVDWRRWRRQLIVNICLILAAFCPLEVQAQNPAPNVQYTNKAVDLGLRGNVTVNPSTRALEIQIPFANYAGRAGFNVPIAVSYSSKVHRMKYEAFNPGHYSSSGQPFGDGYTLVSDRFAEYSSAGWTTSVGFPVQDLTAQGEKYNMFGQAVGADGQCQGTCLTIDRILFRMPDGSTHELRSSDQPRSPSDPILDNYYSVDGARMRYQSSTQTLFMADGSRYILGASPKYVDRNGNTITDTDTLGRAISIPPMAGTGINGGAPGDYPYSLPGVGGAAINYTFKWRYLDDPNVLTSPQALQYVADSRCSPGNGSYSPHLFLSDPIGTRTCIVNGDSLFRPVVLYQIVLPTGQAYTFTYNIYGEIDKIVLPTGGYERYVYEQVAPLTTTMVAPYVQANRGIAQRYVSASGLAADEVLWQYSGGGGGTSVTAPDGSLTSLSIYTDASLQSTFGYSLDEPRAGRTYSENFYSPPDGNGARQLLRRHLNEWSVTGSNASNQFSGAQQAARNARLTKEVEIIFDTGGGALARSTTHEYDLTYQFSTGVNETVTNEYDYVVLDQTTAQTIDVGSVPIPSIPLRRSEKSFVDATNQAYRDSNLLGLMNSVTVRDGAGNIVAQTSIGYDESPLLSYDSVPKWTDPGTNVRGNATSKTNWLNFNGTTVSTFPAGTYVTTHVQYDQCGSTRVAIDAKGNQSQIEYSSSYAYAYPTLMRTPAPDPTGQQGSATPLVSSIVFDSSTGLVTSSTDVNNVTSILEYNDSLNRPTRTVRAYGTPVQSQSTITYDDINRIVTTTSDQNNYDDNLLRRETSYDGLGRAIESRQYEGGTNYIAVQTQYDAIGRAYKTSNPFRPWKSETAIWTTTGFDALSRVTSVTTPDSAVVSTAYVGNSITVTDQAGKQRKSVADGLGRLVQVYEAPTSLNYLTSYTYDTLDNLTGVSQVDPVTGHNQTRSFAYDSLKRLTSAMNPESGVVNYQYDENGNLRVKTDARGVSIHFSYDGLNRATRRWYNSSTSFTAQVNNSPGLPSDVATSNEVGYFYDSQGLPSGAPPNFSRGFATGHLVAVTYGTSSSAGDYYGYDAAGRPVVKIQQTAGTNYQITAAYNLADEITSQFYPSGHIVSYGYDKAGRTTSMTGRLGDGRNRSYATGVSYSAFGGLTQEQFGTQTSIYHKQHYNLRGQLFDIRVSSYSVAANEWDWNRGALVSYYSSNYSWGGNSTGSGLDNNGNVTREQHWTPTNDPNTYSYTQDTYSYDSLSRLISTSEVHGGPNWQSGQDYLQSYDYDSWGNRTINPASTGVSNTQFEKSDAQNTNRLYAPGDLSLSMNQRKMQYDSVGNLTHDSYTGDGRVRSYDADNRLSLLAFPPPQPVCYPDGEGGQICYPVDDSGKNPPIQYVYDGDGRRVQRFIHNQETRQVYGLDGELLAEYAASISPSALQKEYGYRNGELLITATPGTGSSASLGSQSGKGGSSTDLLAKLNTVDLPPFLRGLLSANTAPQRVSDASTPLYGPSFPYASLNGSIPFVAPQSTSAKIAFSSNRDGTAQIYSMNPDGSGALRLTNDAANDEYPRWSPNGSRIVFQSDRDNVFSGMADIYVMNTDGSGQSRLTSDANDDGAPAWSPDGSKIVFQSARNGVNYQIYVMNADGSGQVNVSNSAANDTQPSWSPDGTKIAFASDRDHSGSASVYVMSSAGANQTRLTFAEAPYTDDQPSWSPDSSKIAFTSTRNSTTDTWTETDDDGNVINRTRVNINKEIYVMSANGFGQTRLTNTLENDESPSWSGDGTKIVFRSDRERDCCDPTPQVWMTNSDGSNQLNLSNDQFGDYNPSWCDAVMSPPPPNSAQFVSQSVPQTMTAGQTYAVWVRMKNIGSNTWTTQGAYSLGSQNAQDNTTWGMGRVALPSSDASGSEVTFNFTVTAPSTTGTYNFQWRMVQDGVEWFGGFSPNVSVTVNSQSGGNPGTDPDPSTPYADVRWIVADRLGTPRMVLDESGSLANVSRHDYLPFGEEIAGPIGGRTTQQGYFGDSTRQKFTRYERDFETGLDYAQTRYYSSAQGRFSSADKPFAGQYRSNPQSWNMYSYVLNDPLNFTDPSGLSHWELGPDGKLHFVGDKDKEYNKDLNANWNAKSGVWDFLPTGAKPAQTIHLEALFLRPVLSLKHLSSLGGHMAWNINGTVHSWEDGGWHTYTMDQYKRDNNYRDMLGYVLGDENDPDWAERFADKVLSFQGDGEGILQKLLGVGPYALRQDNCAEAFCRAVNATPGLPTDGAIAPVQHELFLVQRMKPYIRAVHRYTHYEPHHRQKHGDTWYRP
jgi:RHS repeat-associated protein